MVPLRPAPSFSVRCGRLSVSLTTPFSQCSADQSTSPEPQARGPGPVLLLGRSRGSPSCRPVSASGPRLSPRVTAAARCRTSRPLVRSPPATPLSISQLAKTGLFRSTKIPVAGDTIQQHFGLRTPA
ncbi:hypothetical protein NDU88_003503 [Pleurodeles waltl]|uniref:Uncharacterized protein n=1 Tax=Pleurodeles waltl TaxID=8319 RepID=A0AAV7SG57_PLEWA|nr:hypothetical protein NDU88_003503 [Pleurodeles waltl]